MKMNPEIRAQWVAALRSGEYTQTNGTLTRITFNDNSSHCCLGVLCELAVKAGVPIKVETTDGYDNISKYKNYDTALSFLPSSVISWAGIDDDESNPEVWVNGTNVTLSDENDLGAEFEEIANLIENDAEAVL